MKVFNISSLAIIALLLDGGDGEGSEMLPRVNALEVGSHKHKKKHHHKHKSKKRDKKQDLTNLLSEE